MNLSIFCEIINTFVLSAVIGPSCDALMEENPSISPEITVAGDPAGLPILEVYRSSDHT